jgi:hypothetical protein
MTWIARVTIHGRGGVHQTLRFDLKPVDVTDFFYSLRREIGVDYHPVTWRGKWTNMFRTSFRDGGLL